MDLARQMRGRTIWDSTFIEKTIPLLILNKMIATDHWVDEDGFNWGIKYVFADLQNERPFVCVASRSMGQGFHQLKAIFSPSTEITTIYQ